MPPPPTPQSHFYAVRPTRARARRRPIVLNSSPYLHSNSTTTVERAELHGRDEAVQYSAPKQLGKRAGTSRLAGDEQDGKAVAIKNSRWGQIDSGGSPDVAVEVEVDVESAKEEEEEDVQIDQAHQFVDVETVQEQHPSPFYVHPTHLPMPMPTGSRSRQTTGQRNNKIKSPAQYTAQQLIKFDPMQCYDLDELRNRMIAAQQRVEDTASLHLANSRLKHENGQLKEELASCDHQIGLLEATVMERNERLKELLRENVFMRAQVKRIQNEFGVDAVKEVFNRSANSRP